VVFGVVVVVGVVVGVVVVVHVDGVLSLRID
jgi:hypothetical protein